MRAALLGPSQEVLSGRIGARVTAALALVLTLVVSGTLPWPLRWDVWVYCLLCVLLLVIGFSPRATDRVRRHGTYWAWSIAGLGAVWTTGFAIGPSILVVVVALAVVFFSLRAAVWTIGLHLGVLGCLWWSLFRAGWSPPPDLIWPVRSGDWIGVVATFAGVELMLALVVWAALRGADDGRRHARRLALVSELTENAVLITGANRRIVWCNEAFTRLTGVTEAEAIGHSPAEFLQGPGTDVRAVALMRARLAAAEGFTCELVNYRQDGSPFWSEIEVRPIHDSSDGLDGHIGVQRDVTERRLGAELQGIEAELSQGLATTRDRDEWVKTLAGALVRLSPVLCVRIWSAPSEGGATLQVEVVEPGPRSTSSELGARIAALGPPPEAAMELSSGFLNTEPDLGLVSLVARVGDPPGVDVEQPIVVELILDTAMPGHGILARVLPGIAARLTRLRHAAAESERACVLFERSPDALLDVDASGRVRQANARAIELWGPAVQGAQVARFVPGLGPEAAACPELAWRHTRPDGEVVDLEATTAPLDTSAGPGLLVAVRDATDRHNTERRLQSALDAASRALDERKVLLAEVHHRVKNNLQIVSSLLAMQADGMSSPEARAGLVESVHRVRSMALIHGMLYGDPNLAEVDFGAYAAKLAAELQGAFGQRASIRVLAIRMPLTIDLAIPVGLILNELLTNAVKHGHRPGEASRVVVELAFDADVASLVVSDEGPGLPAGLFERGNGSLGVTIIDALTRQVDGRLTVDARSAGCRIELRLPVKPARSARSSG